MRARDLPEWVPGYVDRWIIALCLEHWKIEVTSERSKDYVRGRCVTTPAIWCAEIQVNDGLFDDGDRVELERVIVHELLHVSTCVSNDLVLELVIPALPKEVSGLIESVWREAMEREHHRVALVLHKMGQQIDDLAQLIPDEAEADGE